MEPEEYFAGHPFALAVFHAVHSMLTELGGIRVRTTKSQVAFHRSHSFAYLWLPGRYLARPDAEVVLSIALARHDQSERFKEVVHPTPKRWMHHLEVRDVSDIDDQVKDWLREAADRQMRLE